MSTVIKVTTRSSFHNWTEQGDRSVGGALVWILARFWDGYDFCEFPFVRDGVAIDC